MKKKIIIISGIVLVIILSLISFLIYKNEQERKRKLEEKRIETRYKNVFNDAYKMVNSSTENNDYKAENKDEKIIYEYFEDIKKEKEDLTKITYEEFVNVNTLSKIYENSNELLQKLNEYNEKFKTKKEEIYKINKKDFINYLKEKGCSEKGITILNEKIKNDDIKFNSEEINNIELNNQEKNKVLTDYITYLNNNKGNWYLKNNTIICKTDEVLKTITEKNKEFNINITAEKEPKPKVVTSKQIPVIMYHGVSDTTWGIANLFMKVNDFDSQMKYLKDNGYETIFLEDIEKDYTGKKVVALTFDDGYIDFYTNVLPIIKKYNIKTNLYIITSTMVGKEKYVNENQIKEIVNSGLVSIGSHTVSHSALATLSDEKIEIELKNSKERLETLLGKEIKTISYPTGSYNQNVINIAKKYYKYGITTKRGVQSMGNFNKYEIKRYAMYRSSGISTFKNMVGTAN